MEMKLVTGDGTRVVEIHEGQTVLDVIQAERIGFQAPCGGNSNLDDKRPYLDRPIFLYLNEKTQ